MGVHLDLTGCVFGSLTVVKLHGTTTDRMTRLWDCVCSCGGVKVVPTKRLRNGMTKSCGCLLSSTLRERNTTHGESKSPLYLIWQAMVSRCHNPRNKRFKDYGGRGISVCASWMDYSQFKKDMHPKPIGKTLDRRDNSKEYSKANCRWATYQEQNSNRRNNVLVSMPNGDIVPIAEAARRLSSPRMTLTRRLKSGEFLGAKLWVQI